MIICDECGQAERLDFCRNCSVYFFGGHPAGCPRTSEHSVHRNYREFSAITENGMTELYAEYGKDRIRREARHEV